MPWHAVEEIDQAIEETKELLFPFDWRLWAKIAILTFFVSGLSMPGSLPSPPTGSDLDGGDSLPQDGIGTLADGSGLDGLLSVQSIGSGMDPTTGMWPAMLPLIAVILLLAGVFMVLRPIASFAFYQSLLDKDVVIRQNVKRHAWNGVQLLLFLTAVGIVGLITVLIGLGVAAVGYEFVHPATVIPVLLAAIPAGLTFLVIFQLTWEFVPLTMIADEVNVVQAWQELLPTLLERWRQTAMYLVMRFVLGLVIGIGAGIASILVLVLLAVPVVMMLYAGVGGPLLVAGIGVIAVLLWFAATLYLFRGPAETFLRFYTILVYQDIVGGEDTDTDE